MKPVMPAVTRSDTLALIPKAANPRWPLYRLLACAMMLLMIQACGWQMRGKYQNTSQLGNIMVVGQFANDPVGKTLRRDISAAGGSTTTNPIEADHVVWIGNHEEQIRAASYDVLIRAVENMIIMRVSFEVRNKAGVRVHGPEQIYVERVYQYDVQGVTSSAAQLTIIKREIREDIGHQIALRVASIDPDSKPVDEAAATVLEEDYSDTPDTSIPADQTTPSQPGDPAVDPI